MLPAVQLALSLPAQATRWLPAWLAGWAMLALLLWSLLGLAGTVLALARRDRPRVRKGLLSIATVWAVYLAVLFLVSRTQPVLRTPPGQNRCFDEMCFAVIGAEEPRGFSARGLDPERLVRVVVRISNHGRTHAESEAALRAYLIDAQGRHWTEVAGLSGVRLTTRVPAGGSVVSEPVFHVAADSTGLGLIFSHGFTPSRFVIGDSESFAHRPEILLLPDATPEHAAFPVHTPVPPSPTPAARPLVSAIRSRP